MRKTIAACLLLALVLSGGAGCTTTTQGNQVRVGFDVMALRSYQPRAWVPRAPVIRQLCAVADWYGYSWEKEPWQQLLAHGAVLYLADREAWDNRIQRVIDDLRGKDDEPAAAAASPESLTAADLQLLTAGDYNTITASYTYMPGAATPAVVVQNNGSHNTISVAVQPFEEEEEEE